MKSSRLGQLTLTGWCSILPAEEMNRRRYSLQEVAVLYQTEGSLFPRQSLAPQMFERVSKTMMSKLL